ncbi:MAG: hypothetical protein V8Q85_07545 [Christensenellales bacterium]
MIISIMIASATGRASYSPPYGTDIVKGSAAGYHLMFYPNWIDFYNGNTGYLNKHFGSEKTWREYYCCADAAGFERQIIEDMDRAEALGAKYAVFHCADISNEEVWATTRCILTRKSSAQRLRL